MMTTDSFMREKDNMTDVVGQSGNSSGNNSNPGTVAASDGTSVTLGLNSQNGVVGQNKMAVSSSAVAAFNKGMSGKR